MNDFAQDAVKESRAADEHAGRPKEAWEELLPAEGQGARKWSGEAERALNKWSRERKKARFRAAKPNGEGAWLALKLKRFVRAIRG